MPKKLRPLGDDWLLNLRTLKAVSQSTHCSIQEDVNLPHTRYFRQRSTDILLHQSAPAIFQNYAPTCTMTCQLRNYVI